MPFAKLRSISIETVEAVLESLFGLDEFLLFQNHRDLLSGPDSCIGRQRQ